MAIVTQGRSAYVRRHVSTRRRLLPCDSSIRTPHGDHVDLTRTTYGSAHRPVDHDSHPVAWSPIGTMLYHSRGSLVVLRRAAPAFLTGKLGGLRQAMKAQQVALADEEGFIEEMMEARRSFRSSTTKGDAKDEFVGGQPRNSFRPRRRRILRQRPLALGHIGNMSSSSPSAAS